MGLFIILFVFVSSLGFANRKTITAKNNGIIIATNIYVKSAPDTKSTDLFILHEGVKAQILDNVGEWAKIMLADGKVGFVDEQGKVGL